MVPRALEIRNDHASLATLTPPGSLPAPDPVARWNLRQTQVQKHSMGSFEMKSSASSSENTEPPKRLTILHARSRGSSTTLQTPRASLRAKFCDRNSRFLPTQDISGLIPADRHSAALLPIEHLDPALHKVEDHRASGGRLAGNSSGDTPERAALRAVFWAPSFESSVLSWSDQPPFHSAAVPLQGTFIVIMNGVIIHDSAAIQEKVVPPAPTHRARIITCYNSKRLQPYAEEFHGRMAGPDCQGCCLAATLIHSSTYHD